MNADPNGIPSHARAVPRVASDAFVASNALVIGDVEVGAQSLVWFGCVLRGDVQRIRVGDRSNIQDGVVIHCSTGGEATVVGSDVTVGHSAVLHSCTVEDGAFVGIGACVLDRARIAAGGMLAAGAVLTPGKVVGQGELWAGNPARFLRVLEDGDRAAMTRNSQRYVALAEHYRSEHPAIFNRSSTK